ncbi:MAG: response regulator [Chloroflexi bacterium]|nr:response regulator [Chloroflexota bacterium]
MAQAFHYLYVEDDPGSRDVMRTLLIDLAKVGHLDIFESSANFLARLKSLPQQPDFIFLDINILPEDGYQVIAQIRSDPDLEGISVLAVTAGVIANQIEKMKQAGFNGALSKPIDVSRFVQTIRRLESGQPVWQVS